MRFPLDREMASADSVPRQGLLCPDGALDSWGASVGKGGSAELIDLPFQGPASSWGDLPSRTFPTGGDHFLGFHLVAELGRGAFGRVYLARQDDLAQRLVALKVSAEVQTESHNLAQLQHTHIVPVYSIHRDGALQAVCMPYFGSATLADVLQDLQKCQSPPASGKNLVSTIQDRAGRTKPIVDSARLKAEGGRRKEENRQELSPSALILPPSPFLPPVDVPPMLRTLEGLTYVDAVLWIGERLADGLTHAHDRGILHRDLKPANILLTDDGQPMLLDFNLSTDLKAGASRARVGGTLPYMAPEHLAAFAGCAAPFPSGANAPAATDGRSDVYALGVILFELLTGRPPFEPPTGQPQELLPEMIRRRLGPPPRVRSGNRDVSPAVESILQHCLEPDPARRYQSARQLAEDLDRQRNQRPLAHAPERSLRERATKWLKRNRRPAVLAAAIAGFVLVFCLTAGLTSRGSRIARLEDGNRLSAFHHDQDEANLLLAALPKDADQRSEGLRIAYQALARFDVIDLARSEKKSSWVEQPAVQRMAAEERQRLVQEVGELLLLAAGADEAGKPELIERAAECFPAEQAPRALYVYRSTLANRRGDRTEARLWDETADRRPLRNALDHYLIARNRADKGLYVEASEDLRKAVHLDPKHFAAWSLLGNCCLEGADGPGMGPTEAIRCYTACIALRPKFYGAYYNRGLAYLRQGRYAEAEADFTAALDHRPGFAEARIQRGIVREAQGKLREALADLIEVDRFDNAPGRVVIVRARVRSRLGDKAGAARDEKEALRRPPGDEESYILRGNMRVGGDSAGALADYAEAVKLNPRSLSGLYNQAFVLSEQMRKTKDAVGVLTLLIQRYPNLAGARASRGVLLARLGQRQAAHEDARHACKLAGETSEILYQAACIHALTSRHHDDRNEAFRLLARVLRVGFGHDLLTSDPDLASLRKDPRYRTLVEAVQAFKAWGSPSRSP